MLAIPKGERTALLISVGAHAAAACVAVALSHANSRKLYPAINIQVGEVQVSNPGKRAQPFAKAAPTPGDLGIHAAAGPQGVGKKTSGSSEAAYTHLVREKVEAVLRYPLGLRRRGITGKVTVQLTVLENGALESSHVAQSSGSPELEQLATQAVLEAAPYPPLPPNQAKIELSLPIEFKIQ